MNQIAEVYLDNTLDNAEIHLVSIVTYNETANLEGLNEKEKQKQIEEIIKNRYKNFDNNKINIKDNKILNRITYIVFPVWALDELAEKFQQELNG